MDLHGGAPHPPIRFFCWVTDWKHNSSLPQKTRNHQQSSAVLSCLGRLGLQPRVPVIARAHVTSHGQGKKINSQVSQCTNNNQQRWYTNADTTVARGKHRQTKSPKTDNGTAHDDATVHGARPHPHMRLVFCLAEQTGGISPLSCHSNQSLANKALCSAVGTLLSQVANREWTLAVEQEPISFSFPHSTQPQSRLKSTS